MNFSFFKEASLVVFLTVMSGLCKETGFTMPVMVAFLKLIQKRELQ